MSISAITRPLPGERVIELSPDSAIAAATTWLKRPNLYPGRALTAPTLDARSDWSAGHLAQRGQACTAGVVDGLEVGTEQRASEGAGDERPEVRLHIAAGRGIAVSGEDVVLVQPQQVDFWSLPVVAPASVLAGEGFAGGSLQDRAIGPVLGELLAAQPGALPRAGVLVLQPVTVDRADIDPDDPCDRCGCDEGVVAYEDWRIADGARLLWYAWPEDWTPAPPAGDLFRNRLAHMIFDAERALAPDATLPWESFGVPLALVGVDAGFVPQFCDRSAVVRRGGRPRVSHLQLGPAGQLVAAVRLAELAQAGIEQLAEQVAELGDLAAGGSVDAATLARHFDRLPPAGLLPRAVIDLASHRSEFFPAGFDLDAVPVPVDQLDLAIRESGGLAPLDLARGERLRVLVPVSQASYEPRLLMTETLDPVFEQTLDGFLLVRGRELAGRQSLRVKAAVLLQALKGKAPAVPGIGDDPEALEPETLAPWGPPAGRGGHRVAPASGLRRHGFAGASATLGPSDGDVLYSWVCLDADDPPRTLMLEWRSGTAHRRAYWGDNLIELGTDGRTTRLRLGDLPEAGRWLRLEIPVAALDLGDRTIDGLGILHVDGRVAFAETGLRTADGDTPWFDRSWPAGATDDGVQSDSDAELEAVEFLCSNELLAPFEARLGVVPLPTLVAAAAADGSKADVAGQANGLSLSRAELAADPLLTNLLSGAEQAQLVRRGVDPFIDYLRSRADRADDLIDAGFAKVQTDLYRVRQLVLDTTDASRLTVLPALAGIAKAETAVATRNDLSTFVGRLRAAQDAPTTSVMMVRQPDSGGGANTTTSGPDSAPDASAGSGSGSTPTGFRSLSGAQLQPQNLTFTPQLATLNFTPQLQTDISPIRSASLYTPTDIASANPLIGSYKLRTLSIAERLQMPKAEEARDYSTSTRHSVVTGLLRLADELVAADGDVPGLFEDIDIWGLAGDFGENADNGTPPKRTLRDFIDVSKRTSLLQFLLKPPVRLKYDEATHFSDSAELADRTVALLRQIEGRVKRYREAITRCEQARDALQKDLRSVGLRERSHADALAEARHDVAVTRALIAEEQGRLDAINARRAAVLADEVRFVAYIRPRAVDTLSPAVSRPLDPGLLEAPVPECLQAHEEVPDALGDMLVVLREAPAAWFRTGPQWLGLLDRGELLLKALDTAQVRARIRAPLPVTPAPSAQLASGALAAAIGKVRLAQLQAVQAVRRPLLQLDLSRLATLNWQGLHAEALKLVSLGDLIDGVRGRSLAARNAAAFFDRYSHICGCLHAGFSGVLPSIRLEWAELLSEFDAAPNLRNLANLPRWSAIGYVERRRMQGLVDWLFDQIATDVAAAQNLVNDIVRMCLLLASHAPVDRIIAGRLPRPVVARPGLRIPLLALDTSRLRIGMHALVYRGSRIVARAQVEDLGSEVSARVIHTEGAEIRLTESDRVQFAEAAAISFAAPPATLALPG